MFEKLIRTAILMAPMSLFGVTASSQSVTNPVATLKESKTLIYGLDNRQTFIANQRAVIYGFYLGLGFGGKLRYKMGLNGTPFEISTPYQSGTTQKSRLAFISIGEEFDFLYWKKFCFTSYLQGGVGQRYADSYNANASEPVYSQTWLYPLEIGLHWNYQLAPWLKLHAGGGWRWVFPSTHNDLTAAYLKLGLGVNFKALKQKDIDGRRQKE